ncbi:hypothetical protein FPV67DRAFT_1529587 [Lyophyllum atratum]|nr:hypothetical protein FPV67DRAFT_1529587 [Lyophyllum atratum]
MRLAPFGLIAASLLAVVSTFPIPSSQVLSRNSALCDSSNHDASPYTHRDQDPAPRDFDFTVEDLTTIHGGSFGKQRAKKDKKKAEKAKKAEQGKKNAAAEGEKAKVTFGDGAKKALNSMGLHGKNRKAAKEYHQQIVKEEMKINGAHKAKVVALAHEGGSVETEKNHITTHFSNAMGGTIKSEWVDKASGKQIGGLHHVYPDQHPGVTRPESLADAQAKPAGPSHYALKAKAKKDKAAADKAAKDQEKADRVAGDRANGLASQAGGEKKPKKKQKADRAAVDRARLAKQAASRGGKS